MTIMKIDKLKGTENYNVKEQILRNKITYTIKTTLEKYGFNPIETPILQTYSLLSSKYCGGEEILNECYKLKDRGNRNIGLRYELTITLAQFISENKDIKIPFKKYEIGKIFRDGPVKKSRYREFTQIDFDIIGAKSGLPEIEILSIYEQVFKKLNININIRLNNRKILFDILEYAGIPNNLNTQNSIILTIDKLEKIGATKVKKELLKKGLNDKQIQLIFDVIEIKGNNEEILTKFSEILKTKNAEKNIEELYRILDIGKSYNLKSLVLSPSLARGLNYYTGTIYEVFQKSGTNSSLAAGGRYDEMLSKFFGRDLPCVGGSFGLDSISCILKPDKLSNVQIYLIPIKISEHKFLPILIELRKNFNVDFDLSNRGIKKNLEFADKKNIPFCIIVGQNELNSGKLNLKNMVTRQEKKLSLKEIIELIKNN